MKLLLTVLLLGLLLQVTLAKEKPEEDEEDETK
ncbi:unnamed protein product, partial [Dibothriocephalus latus]